MSSSFFAVFDHNWRQCFTSSSSVSCCPVFYLSACLGKNMREMPVLWKLRKDWSTPVFCNWIFVASPNIPHEKKRKEKIEQLFIEWCDAFVIFLSRSVSPPQGSPSVLVFSLPPDCPLGRYIIPCISRPTPIFSEREPCRRKRECEGHWQALTIVELFSSRRRLHVFRFKGSFNGINIIKLCWVFWENGVAN